MRWFWDIKGGFQIVVREEVMDRMSTTKVGWPWQKWVTGFMDEREFLVLLDSKDRRKGKTNMGVPQGSPLSLLVFLI